MNNVFRIQALMTLGDFISGPIESIRRSFQACAKDSEGLAGRIETLGKRFAPFAVAAGLVIGGMAATALATVDTSKALGELASVGVKDMDAMKAAAQDFSNTWAGTSQAEFISAAYDVKSAISSLSDTGVAEFTKLAALTGKASKASADTMTSLFATGYGIYKSQYKELSDIQFGELFSGGLAAAVNIYKSSGEQMAAAIENLGSTATSSNISLEEQFAVLGKLQQTMKGSEAGTRYTQFILQAADAGKQLGLSFVNAEGQLRTMPEIIETLRKKYGDTLDEIEKGQIAKAFGSVEALKVVLGMYDGMSDLQGGITEVSKAMKMGSAYTTEMAKKMNEDLGAKIEIAEQKLSNFIQIIGSLFVPIISTAVTFIAWLAGGFQSIFEVMGKNPFLAWLVQMTAMLALTVSVVGMFGAFKALLPGIITLIRSYAGGMWAGATATIAATWPIYVLVAAIGLLFLAYKANFLGIGDTLRGWYNTVKLVVEGVRAVFANLRGRDFTITGDLADKLKAGGLVGIVTVIAGTLYRLWQVLRGVGDVAKAVAALVGPIFGAAFLVLWGAVTGVVSIFEELWGVISTIVTPIIKLIGLIDPNVWRVLGMAIGLVVAVLGVVGIAIGIYLMAPLLPLIGLIVGATATIWGFIKILQLLAMVFGFAIKSAFGGFVMLGTVIFDGIGKIFNAIGDFLGTINLADVGRKIWETLISGIKSKAGDTVNAVKSVFGKIANFFHHSDAKEGPLSTLTLSGNRLLSTFAEGVNRGVPALRRSVGIALTGMIPLTAGADMTASATPRTEPVTVIASAPVVRQETPVMKPAAPVTVPASPVITAAPSRVTPPPVSVAAPVVSVANAAPVSLAAPVVTQAQPVVPAPPVIQIEAASVTVAAPVVEQIPPVMPAAPPVTAPAPTVVPVGPVAMPGIQIRETAPTVTPTAPINMAAPAVTQAQPVIPTPPVIRIEAAEVMVVGPVIEQIPPVMPAAQTIAAPAPEITPAAPVTAPVARVEMAAPGVVTPAPVMVAAPTVSVVEAAPVEMAAPEMVTPPAAEAPAFGSTPLPEPVSRETVRETTQETVRVERVQTPAGESRRYTITIQNLNLPNVTDARSFTEELSGIIDGYDGGKG